MELPVLDRFCFVFDLKLGCMCMGILNSVLTIIQTGILLTFAVAIRNPTELQLKREDEDVMSSVVYTIVVLMVVLLVIKFLLDLVFVYGVYMENINIIKTYLIFWVIFLVLFIIGFLKSMFHMSAGLVVSLVFFLAENFYYIVVIRSYLLTVGENGTM